MNSIEFKLDSNKNKFTVGADTILDKYFDLIIKIP